MKLTLNQLRILQIICTGNESVVPEQQLVDLDELVERTPRKVTKANMQFTIRSLILNGMITKEPLQTRRGRNRVCYKATPTGLHIGGARPHSGSAFTIAQTEAEVQELLSGAA